MLESYAGVVPSTQRHDPAEKHWCIFQGIAGFWFPPTNAASNGSQIPENRLHRFAHSGRSLSIQLI